MIQTIPKRLRFVAHAIVKRIKQVTRPANRSGAGNLIIDLTRSKHDLLAENALLRQQLIVLRRSQKRPRLSNWDRKYGHRFSAVAKATGIEEIQIPFGAPDANAVCERFVGSLRRECLDHMLVLNQKHLNVITRDYVDYYNRNRPHQGLAQSISIPADDPPTSGEIIALPVLGGLHHHYRRAA